MEFEKFQVIIDGWFEKKFERNDLNWFNLDKIERNWKFKDEFETISQFRKLIKGLIEKKLKLSTKLAEKWKIRRLRRPK
jgi:hypothetical protein